MADCKINNAAVKKAVKAIEDIQVKYKKAGTDFCSSFDSAISSMEGASKDALQKLFDDNYRNFVSSEKEGIPAMIGGFSQLLEGNRTNFKDIDSKLAESMSKKK